MNTQPDDTFTHQDAAEVAQEMGCADDDHLWVFEPRILEEGESYANLYRCEYCNCRPSAADAFEMYFEDTAEAELNAEYVRDGISAIRRRK